MFIDYMGMGYEAKGCVVSIDTVGAKGGKVICSIRPRLHKAGKAKRFRGKMRKVIKGIGRNDIREVRYRVGEGGTVSQVSGMV